MRYKKFYSELGKLLYAIANIDGKIAPAERKKLHEMVNKELVPFEKHTDEHGTDAAFYTEIEFDFLDEHLNDPNAAFESFLQYIDDHHSAIDTHLVQVTRKVASALADVYHHTNKKEKLLLNRLDIKLNELESRS